MSGMNCTSTLARALASTVLLFEVSSVYSAEPSEIEETVVVASRVATPISALGVSVTTIDQQELELLGYNNIASVLDLQPGVSVTQDGGLGKASTVRIRGEEGFRTRVLLDGIDIADPSSPQVSPRLEHLLTPGIQRIEILRGPQGLMYGADGGGVIAITTLKADKELLANFGVETGSDGFQRINADLAAGLGAISGALSISDVTTDGYNIRSIDAVNPDNDGYSNTTVHVTVSAELSEQVKVGATLHGLEGDNEYDGCFDTRTFATINDCRDGFQQDAWRTWARWEGDQVSNELSLERSSIERSFFSAEIESFRTEGEQQEVSWITNISLADAKRITFGADIQQQTLNDSGDRRERDNTGLYAEYQQAIGLGTATAGIRHDDNDDFGQHNSWRISTTQTIESKVMPITFRAAIGTGFRAPSLYEIAYNEGPWAFPPASGSTLQEELSRGWEAGLQLGSADRFLAVTWFDQSIEDEIYFDLMTYAGYLQRDGSSSSEGIELSGATPLGAGLALTANLTWNEAQDHLGSPRPYRPELSGAASVRYEDQTFSSALTYRMAQDSYDNFGQPMPDYRLVDWSLAIELGSGFIVNGRIENLTNENYEQVRGYYGADRRWFAGVRYRL